jgi:cell wall assembly regulator SMI1
MSERTNDARVEQAWQDIVAWCRQHAPKSAARLRPPAGEQAILDAERATGVTWPSELKCWYRMHDGAEWLDFDAYFFPLSSPLSLDAVVKTHRMMLEVWSELIDLAGGATIDELMAKPAGDWANIFIPAYVPFAVDCGTEKLVVDTRAGELSGAIRTFDKVEADGEPEWASLADALEYILAALTQGRKTQQSVGWYAGVEDGRLVWKL